MPKLIDLTGQRFGKLTVVKEHGRKNSIVTWECHCDCGAVTIVKTAHLRSRYTFSCGCLEDAEWGDLTGQKFGKLTVISKYERGHSARVRWLCQCECGKTHIANSKSLQNGNSNRSCGCDRVKMRRHGMIKTPEYSAWANMIHRCTNPNNDFWKDYGGRGPLLNCCAQVQPAITPTIAGAASAVTGVRRGPHLRFYSLSQCQAETIPVAVLFFHPFTALHHRAHIGNVKRVSCCGWPQSTADLAYAALPIRLRIKFAI